MLVKSVTGFGSRARCHSLCWKAIVTTIPACQVPTCRYCGLHSPQNLAISDERAVPVTDFISIMDPALQSADPTSK